MSYSPGYRLGWWGLILAVGVGAAIAFELVLSWLPGGWRRPLLLTIVLAPWLWMWIRSSSPLFAIGTWLLPATLVTGLALVAAPYWLFIVVLLAILLGLWSITCTQTGWRIWARIVTRIGERLAGFGLPRPERTTHRRLLALLRPPLVRLRPAGQQGDVGDTISELRGSAEEMLKIEPPDQLWASVIRLSAEPRLMYADMLEGKRTMDRNAVSAAAQDRDDALSALMRSRSPIYRLISIRLWNPQEETSQPT